ncbi:MAG: hypothetical protein E6R04_02410 [Spirochaetes bacterium]|nr:MAG: hypothetical protein E6R04_02410 [Spirochaetota bacterium]
MKLNYNEHSLKPGIYKILNTHTGRSYIGQAKRFKERWRGHKSALLNSKHGNCFLQADFNKTKELLGHDDFLEFHVLEVMEGSTKKERNQKEEEYIKLLFDLKTKDGSRLCYNLKEQVNSAERRQHSNTPEVTRLKKSASMKEKWKEPEYRESLSATQKEFWNTEQGRANASERARSIWADPRHQKAMSERMKEMMSNQENKEQAMKKLNIQETVEKRSATYRERLKNEPDFAAKMQAHGRKSIAKWNSTQPAKTYGSVVAPDGTIYENVSHIPTFAKEHGLWKQGLYALFHGKVKTHKGWTLFTDNDEIERNLPMVGEQLETFD